MKLKIIKSAFTKIIFHLGECTSSHIRILSDELMDVSEPHQGTSVQVEIALGEEGKNKRHRNRCSKNCVLLWNKKGQIL